jgi:uncharacterized protein (TIGR00251 family)
MAKIFRASRRQISGNNPTMTALPPWIRVQAEAVMLAVKLQPRAARNEIGSAIGAELKIKVTAPPVDAAANEALLRLLAATLDCPRGAVRLIRGHTARHKTIQVTGLAAEEIGRRLGQGRDPS